MSASLRLGEVVNPQLLCLGAGHSDTSPGHVYGGLYQSPPGDGEVPEPLPGCPVASHLPGHGHGLGPVLTAVLSSQFWPLIGPQHSRYSPLIGSFKENFPSPAFFSFSH